MKTVGAFEAKTHFAALLARVSNGESIIITKRGTPAAVLAPVENEQVRDPKELVRRIRELRKGCTLGGLTIRELIDEGRRY